MTKTGLRQLLSAAAFVGGLTVLAPAAQAQATRTWISGVGDDANPCSRTAPCKTFAGAISKTAAGGEINCLDPGGWGAVTITKSITLDCSQFPGGILISSGNGINIVVGATDVVVIRGLTITGIGSSPGTNGIRFASAGSLTLENVIIRYQSNAGVAFIPTGASELVIINSTITSTGNAAGTTGGGIVVAPTGAGTAQVTLRDTRLVNNNYYGLFVDTSGSTAVAGTNVVDVAADNSVFSSNFLGVNVIAPSALARVTVTNSVVSHNNRGIALTTAAGLIRVSNSTITGNNRGVGVNGTPTGTSGIFTFSNNRLNGNNTDGTFTGTIATQ